MKWSDLWLSARLLMWGCVPLLFLLLMRRY
jgi:hypothetical protein